MFSSFYSFSPQILFKHLLVWLPCFWGKHCSKHKFPTDFLSHSPVVSRNHQILLAAFMLPIHSKCNAEKHKAFYWLWFYGYMQQTLANLSKKRNLLKGQWSVVERIMASQRCGYITLNGNRDFADGLRISKWGRVCWIIQVGPL